MKQRRERSEKFVEARREAIADGRVAAWGVEEFAVSHGISPGHVRNAIRRGDLQASKLGRRVVIPALSAQAWISAHLIQTQVIQTQEAQVV